MAEQDIYVNIINSLDRLPLEDLDEATLLVINDMNVNRELLELPLFTNNVNTVIYTLVKEILTSMKIRYYPTTLQMLNDIISQYDTTVYNGYPATTPQALKFNLELLNSVKQATIRVVSEGVYNPIIELNETETPEIKLDIAKTLASYSAIGDIKFTVGANSQATNMIDGIEVTMNWDYLTYKNVDLVLNFTRNYEETNVRDLQDLVQTEAQLVVDTFFSKAGVDILYQYFQFSKDILGVKNIDVVFTVETDPSITNENIILAPNEIVTFTNITATEVT